MLDLIKKIKSKKELKNLDNNVVRGKIVDYLKKNSLRFSKLNKSQVRNLIKKIRKELHSSYGVFQLNFRKRRDYFEELRRCLKKNKVNCKESIKLHNRILSMHKSSKERLEVYPKLYDKLFKLSCKPRVILDLSAGLNVFSFPYMKLENIKYIASELNLEDCRLIRDYFKLIKLKGKCIKLDLFRVGKLPKSDITFIFKVFKILEKNSFKLAEKILGKLECKYVIVSFSTKTISNRRMNFPYYPGFERMLKRLKLGYRKLLIGNELFFIIRKFS